MSALIDSVNAIEEQEWLDPASDSVQKVVSKALNSSSGKPVDNLLNGTWLGHPVHPVVTDIPTGAWTVTAICDALESFTGRTELAAGADAALAIGFVGALTSAATGLAQWQYTEGKPRRLGMAHALLNTCATLLYGSSLALRASGRRRAGKVTALLGYGTVLVSAYLGGDLSYGDRLGVTHSDEEPAPSDFVAVLPESELSEGKPKRVDIGNTSAVLVRQGGQVYALGSTCSHLGGPLAEGKLGDGCVTCPWHGSRFSLSDGSVLDGPATFPQPCYATRIRSGMIELRQA